MSYKTFFGLVRIDSHWLGFRIIPISVTETMQVIPYQSETKFSIRLNRSSNSVRLKAWFRIHSDCCSDLLGLGRIDFLPFFIKRDTKSFSDWFGMICIVSDTDIGMNGNNCNWLGMNSYPIFSPRLLLSRITMDRIFLNFGLNFR